MPPLSSLSSPSPFPSLSCARVLTASAPPEARAAAAGAHLVALAGPHYPLLTPDARAAVARLAAALVGGRSPGAAAAAGALVRHVRSGCAAPENLALATCLAACLADGLDWLVGEGAGTAPLAQAALLMVARLLPVVALPGEGGEGGGGGNGGGAPAAAAAAASFRRAAAALAMPLLTEHWDVVAPGGRDLAAALGGCRGVAEVAGPLAALGAVAAAGAGPHAAPFTPGSPLARAASRRPPAALIASRIPPDAEVRLHFLLSSVRLGNQARYQAWYAGRHLAWPGAGAAATSAAVVDTVRFVVAVYRPSAAVLVSDVLPRWALLGWLVTVPRSPAGCAAAAAAAVADWAAFDPASDSFMAAEPAALLMLHSLPRYAHVTASVLDALVGKSGASGVDERALSAGADALVSRGVLRSFDRLAGAPEVPAGLRARVRAVFGRHLSQGAGVKAEEDKAGAAPNAAPTTTTAPLPPPPPPPPPPAPADSGPGSASTATVTDAPPASEPAPPAAAAAGGAKRRRAGTPAEEDEEKDAKKEEAAAAAEKCPPPPPPPAEVKIGSVDAALDAALAALKTAVSEAEEEEDDDEGAALSSAVGAVLEALAGKAAPPSAPASKRRRGGTPAESGGRADGAPPPPALVKDAADGVAALAGSAASGLVAWCGEGRDDARRPLLSLASHAPPRASLCGAVLAACLGAGPRSLPVAAALVGALRARPPTCDVGWRLLAVAVAAEERGAGGAWGGVGGAAAAAAPPSASKPSPAKPAKGKGKAEQQEEEAEEEDPCVGPAAASAFRLHHHATSGEDGGDAAASAALVADLGGALATAGPAALALAVPPLLRGLSVDWGGVDRGSASPAFPPAQPVRGVPRPALRLLCALAGAGGTGDAPLLAAAADAASGRASAVVVGGGAGATADPAARYEDAAFAAAVADLVCAAADPSPSPPSSSPWPPRAVHALWSLIRAEALGHHRGRDTAAAVAAAVLGSAGRAHAHLAASPSSLAGLVPLLAALQPSAPLVKAVLGLPPAAASMAEVALAAWAAPDAGGAAGARAAAAGALEKAGAAVVGGGNGGGGRGAKAGARKGGRSGGAPATVRALWGAD